MIGVEKWAEIRRMKFVEGCSIREIHRLTGYHRDTIRSALESDEPPRYERQPRPSKLDPFKGEIHAQLRDDPRIPSQRLRELCAELGYGGGKTIFDDYVREVRPRYLPLRTYQRTTYRPGELCQFDLWEPSQEIPVGHGQTRRGWMLTAKLPFSRALAGSLIFSKELCDLRFGMSRCLARLGALPAKLVWDREGAIHAGGGRPTEGFAAFCGALPVGWIILERGDAEAKGALERDHRYLRTNFEPARSFANHLDFQAQFDAWTDKANARTHRTTRAIPAERLEAERCHMRPLPDPMPQTEHRFTTRVPQQPYLRWDRNDYSLDPRLAGRRVEVRISQREVSAVALDTGELACRHPRSFARGLTFTDPAHQRLLDELRGERRREPEVERRPLAGYDRLIPA
ncbi:MAG: IS21 family transposase [Solirubrobacterales bacterium]